MRRRFFIPEVVQTSAMDCGPAALKALFGGFGIYLSYGRLREACQTDVDGTSIDTLETVAQQLGMDAAQMLTPSDLLLLDESRCLPAIVVVRLPAGGAHFVVLWRVHGSLVQVMDPAAGRVWIPRRRFLSSLYIHEQPVPRADWEQWSQSPAFTAGLRRRLRALGIHSPPGAAPALLDASLRLAGALLEAGKLRRGAQARELLDLCARNPEQIPAEFWTVRPLHDDPEQLRMRGAVLIVAAGPHAEAETGPLPESLEAVRREPPPRIWAPVRQAVRDAGWLLPAMIAAATIAAAAGAVLEALLFRGLFDLARHLRLSGQRLGAWAALMAFVAGLLALEWPAAFGLLRLGRHLEIRLRARFLLKLPRLEDRYFQSRLISDMAFRAHSLELLRQLPELAGRFVRHAAAIVITAAAIAWFYPGAAVSAACAALAAVAVPLVFQPALVERDLRFREITGALSRFYLDALVGVRAIQAHCAGRTLRAAQAGQLAQWADAGLRQQALLVRAEAAQLALSLGIAAALVYMQAGRAQNPAALLLLVYWALAIPAAGRQLAAIVWSLPALRNTLLRFLEPLGAREEPIGEAAPPRRAAGVAIGMDGVSVVAAGQVILDNVTLHASAGEHIAVVGLSGAGKSSLAGLLLGWHKPAAGTLQVDGAALDAGRLAQLRRETAWIDPQVYLFHAPLFDNLTYGNGPDAAARIGDALDQAGLADVLDRLPDGLQTSLGDAGALVSGGEGQRVRMGRALARPGVRLAILDEPARGLDRAQRRDFLSAARRHFSGATLLAITHDVADTLDFDRVLVVHHGRIVEQGLPHRLYEETASRYRALCEEEKSVERHLWRHPLWRCLRLSGGVLMETTEARQWTRA